MHLTLSTFYDASMPGMSDALYSPSSPCVLMRYRTAKHHACTLLYASRSTRAYRLHLLFDKRMTGWIDEKCDSITPKCTCCDRLVCKYACMNARNKRPALSLNPNSLKQPSPLHGFHRLSASKAAPAPPLGGCHRPDMSPSV